MFFESHFTLELLSSKKFDHKFSAIADSPAVKKVRVVVCLFYEFMKAINIE